MCCCCGRFCCGAPTTDERIHAPVLHDASQMPTAGIGVALHYHQLLVVVLIAVVLIHAIVALSVLIVLLTVVATGMLYGV